jgi:SAM-dependent methyltransferase
LPGLSFEEQHKVRKEVIDGAVLQGHQGDGAPLRLAAYQSQDGHVMEGALFEPDGSWYPIMRGVPSFLRGELRPDLTEFALRHALPPPGSAAPRRSDAEDQALTNATFSDKWRRFKSYGLEEGHQTFLFEWYCRKLGLPTVDALRAFYSGKSRILEVGPGSGFNSRFMAQATAGTVVAVDISEAAYTTFENTRGLPNCHVLQADLMDLPLADGSFDFVIADGVLHHTPDTRAAVRALYRKLRPGGQFFFYVYRRMGPARQFCDELIRAQFTQLAPEDCYKACEGLTELGRELSKLGARVRLDKGVPVLGIPAGEHDVQRLLYYSFVKCFWNDAFDFDTNNMVNFDWYHPHNAWQHTEEEVKGWLAELGVVNYRFNPANPNGLSVLLERPA